VAGAGGGGGGAAGVVGLDVKPDVQNLGGDFPGIDCTPTVGGGYPCVAGTRIPVWLLEAYRRQGVSERELVDSYPSLRAEDLAGVMPGEWGQGLLALYLGE
jgi:uncharacterized protein (DUF433 family)